MLSPIGTESGWRFAVMDFRPFPSKFLIPFELLPSMHLCVPVLLARVLPVAFCLAVAGTEAVAESVIRNSVADVVEQFCVDCHNGDKKKGDLNLESIGAEDIGGRPEIWEKVVRRVRARQMPPAGKDRPDEETYSEVVAHMERELDRAAEQNLNPGRTETFRRLNRTEYRNAIRDLLAVEIDAAALLPKDEAGHGFDNVTVGTLSPTLLDRYVAAAQKVSALAVGSVRRTGGETFRIRPDVTQEDHVEGLPLGTRGGTLISHSFPADGDYEVQVRLTRDRNEEIEGLREDHEMIVLLDDKEVASFKVSPPK